MIKVSISSRHHGGYHYELIEHPPRNINYFVEHPDCGIYIDALFDNPDDWEKYLFFSNFYQGRPQRYIHYFSHPGDLIHSHLVPVLNPVPHVIDMEAFYFPYLIGFDEFISIHRLKKTLISVDKFPPKAKARLEKTKTLLRSKFCKKILPWSKWCRDYTLDFIDEPEIAEKIEVLYPAVHNVAYKRKPAKNIRLLFISGFRNAFERKGGDDMLRAFDVLSARYSNLELNFIGLVPRYIRDKYRKHKNLFFSPYLRKEELFEAYKRSDIFLLPTRHDSFGFSLLEAMNFSLPIVATKGGLVPATQEIVNHGKSGFLIDIKEGAAKDNIAGCIDFEKFISAIEILIENKKMREKMGEAGKEEIASGKFSLKKRNKRLKEIYEEALSI